MNPSARMNLETLVERARQGDTDAWSTLYQAYAGPMKGVCIRLLGRRDEAAEDLVHDAFLLAFADIGKLRNPQRFGQWLTSIVTHLTLQHLERRRRHPSLPLADLPFIHLLPARLYNALLKTCGESAAMRRELLDIKRCGLSIETFEALLPQTGLQSFRRTLWLVNPHYQQKFGLRPRRMPRWAGRLKYLRNYASTSCWYLLGHTAGKETEEQHPCGKKKQEGRKKFFPAL